jgi:DNA-binding transcriptional ArsR family regulator
MASEAPWVQPRDAGVAALLGHPVRAALLELLGRVGTVTATEAARELGGNTGLHSFHLRQLERYGLIEELPGRRSGRRRPWRLVDPHRPAEGDGLDLLARGLEDESYQRWLSVRDRAPEHWQKDEAFSQVVYLTPRELSEVGAVIRRAVGRYRPREESPAHRPPGAAPVAVVARLFPLLAPDDEPGRRQRPGDDPPAARQT